MLMFNDSSQVILSQDWSPHLPKAMAEILGITDSMNR